MGYFDPSVGAWVQAWGEQCIPAFPPMAQCASGQTCCTYARLPKWDDKGVPLMAGSGTCASGDECLKTHAYDECSPSGRWFGIRHAWTPQTNAYDGPPVFAGCYAAGQRPCDSENFCDVVDGQIAWTRWYPPNSVYEWLGVPPADRPSQECLRAAGGQEVCSGGVLSEPPPPAPNGGISTPPPTSEAFIAAGMTTGQKVGLGLGIAAGAGLILYAVASRTKRPSFARNEYFSAARRRQRRRRR